MITSSCLSRKARSLGWTWHELRRGELLLPYPLLQVTKARLSREAWRDLADTWLAGSELAALRGIIVVRTRTNIIIALVFYAVVDADGVRRLLVPGMRVIELAGTEHALQEVLHAIVGFARRCGCRELIIVPSLLPPEPVLEAGLARLAGRHGLRRRGQTWCASVTSNVVPLTSSHAIGI
jgi:hypothetical protein